ncbi:MAG: Gfo/Idh/MocA family oxidoreductase, partial [Cyanobacteria bacterium]|nr:Gfo/Idh/MocA family oxidoreductase [Cyanobacteriota bacterium]
MSIPEDLPSIDSETDLSPLKLGGKNPEQLAVVGCGNWGKNLVRNFYGLEFLHSVCDLNKSALKTLQKSYKGVYFTTNFQEILDNPLINGVVISTPSHTHYKLAKAAILSGKHVYVEKPIATSCVETQELYALSQEHHKILMVGHLLLYHPAVKRLKQLINQGYLGKIKYIQSDRLNFNPNRQDKSVIWDLAPHDLSMISYLLGSEPTGLVSVNGHKTSTDGLVDVAHLELLFPGDIGGHIHNSWIHPAKQVKLIVRGTEKIAVIDDTLGTGKLQIFSKDDDNSPIKEFPDYLAIEPLKLECQHFINCIRSGKTPNTDGINGYQVVKILELAEKM